MPGKKNEDGENTNYLPAVWIPVSTYHLNVLYIKNSNMKNSGRLYFLYLYFFFFFFFGWNYFWRSWEFPMLHKEFFSSPGAQISEPLTDNQDITDDCSSQLVLWRIAVETSARWVKGDWAIRVRETHIKPCGSWAAAISSLFSKE